MRRTGAAVAAVVFCAFFVQAGNGLQADLIGTTASQAFAPAVIGLMLASYYVGFSLAPLSGRAVIGRSGHVAAVLVCVIAAAAVILVQPRYVNAPAWAGFRAVSGFALSLSYVAVESWINDAVSNASRGRVFAVYMFAQMAGMSLSQMLFWTAGGRGYLPYLLSALLFLAAALAPLAFRRAAPSGAPPQPLGIAALFRVSPVGAVATVLSGLSWSILFAFGPVYAKRSGLDAAGVSLFMGLAVVAGGIVQVPAGWLSDRIGRRPVLAAIFAAGLAACGLGLSVHGTVAGLIAVALTGGFVYPIYAIAVATVNDGVSPPTRVAAASGLVLLFGIGSVFGPLACGAAIAGIGNAGFYGLLAATMAAGVAACLGLRRSARRAPAPE